VVFFNKKGSPELLKRIIIKNPTENSKPATPKIKKVMERGVMSSFTAPIVDKRQYRISQTISEKRINDIKLVLFIIKPEILTQNSKFQ
jgi:hypothetical protein